MGATIESEVRRLTAQGYSLMPQHTMHDPCKALEKRVPSGVEIVWLHSRTWCPHKFDFNADGSITIVTKSASIL